MSKRISAKKETEKHNESGSENVGNLVHPSPERSGLHHLLKFITTLVQIFLKVIDSLPALDENLGLL